MLTVLLFERTKPNLDRRAHAAMRTLMVCVLVDSVVCTLLALMRSYDRCATKGCLPKGDASTFIGTTSSNTFTAHGTTTGKQKRSRQRVMSYQLSRVDSKGGRLLCSAPPLKWHRRSAMKFPNAGFKGRGQKLQPLLVISNGIP